MCMYKIYPAKIASSSFVVQSCFQIKIIGPLRSLKALCHGRSRSSQKWPGPRKASGTPAKSGRVPQENFAGAPRPRKASKHAAERFRGLGKLQNTPLNVSEASEGLKHAAERFRGLGRHQGRQPSWPGTSGELRRRPEISEGVRNAG